MIKHLKHALYHGSWEYLQKLDKYCCRAEKILVREITVGHATTKAGKRLKVYWRADLDVTAEQKHHLLFSKDTFRTSTRTKHTGFWSKTSPIEYPMISILAVGYPAVNNCHDYSRHQDHTLGNQLNNGECIAWDSYIPTR